MTHQEIDRMISDTEDRKTSAEEIGDDFYSKWQESRVLQEGYAAQLIVLQALKEKSTESEQLAFAEGMARGKNIDLNKHAAKLSEIVQWFVNQDKQ